MDRCTILECMYDVIKESAELGVSEDDYGVFVDGVVAMTEAMLKKEEERHAKMIEALRNCATAYIGTNYTDAGRA